MLKTFFFKSPGVEQWQSLPLGLFVEGLFCGGLSVSVSLCAFVSVPHVCRSNQRPEKSVRSPKSYSDKEL